MNLPEGAKLVGGVWLPATEEHFVEMMSPGAKRFREVDGRWTYQHHKLERAMRHVPAERRRGCVDVGAHVGLWSMHLVKLFERVEAFEPVPLHAELFQRNVREANCNLHRIALGDRETNISIHVPEDTTGNAHVATDAPMSNGHGAIGQVDGISMFPLDHFGFKDVDFIKIDVEGYELPVVKGARETLRRNRPVVLVEQKGNEARFYGGKPNEALAYLEDLGMKRLDVISGDHILGWP